MRPYPNSAMAKTIRGNAKMLGHYFDDVRLLLRNRMLRSTSYHLDAKAERLAMRKANRVNSHTAQTISRKLRAIARDAKRYDANA